MNAKIIHFLQDIINRYGINYNSISKDTGIEYQRLMQIFDQYETISGSELICLGRALEVDHSKLMDLLNDVAKTAV